MMKPRTDYAQIRVGQQGRVVIPAALRKALGICPGQTLVARVDDGRLTLEAREAIVARIRARFAHLPPGDSLADELIAERREAARREASE